MDVPRRESRRVSEADPNALKPTDTAFRKMSVANPDMPNLIHEAKDATDTEKSMTIMQAFRTYPKAVMFSMCLSTAIIMEGYDVVLLAQLYAFHPSPNGTVLQQAIPKTHTRSRLRGKQVSPTVPKLEKSSVFSSTVL